MNRDFLLDVSCVVSSSIVPRGDIPRGRCRSFLPTKTNFPKTARENEETEAFRPRLLIVESTQRSTNFAGNLGRKPTTIISRNASRDRKFSYPSKLETPRRALPRTVDFFSYSRETRYKDGGGRESTKGFRNFGKYRAVCSPRPPVAPPRRLDQHL